MLHSKKQTNTETHHHQKKVQNPPAIFNSSFMWRKKISNVLFS